MNLRHSALKFEKTALGLKPVPSLITAFEKNILHSYQRPEL